MCQTISAAADRKIHVFEDAGLGRGPFRFVCIISLPAASLAETNPAGYENAMREACRDAASFGVGLGTCDYCGTALMNNCILRDADGKFSVVGLDCVLKLHDDRALVSAAKLAERNRQKAIREAKRAAEWERTRPEREAREAAFQAQRQAEEEARQAAAAVHASENAWLIEVLSQVTYSDFAQSVAGDLARKSIREFSGRCLAICGEIYAKQVGGRKGSKAYNEALDAFHAKIAQPE